MSLDSPAAVSDGQEPPLPILYRDDRLIAIHKPSGLLVHRSNIDRHETRFAIQLLRDQIGQRVYPVHRLDKGTSGVLLFALDREMLTLLARQFEQQHVDKTYLAVVRGHPPEAGEIDHPLVLQVDALQGKSDAQIVQTAQTGYRRLATVELPHAVDRYPTSRYALLELKPHTGRRHQLRRHMKHIAHPIIGDATYGKGRHNRLFQELFGCHRLLLAAMAMRFVHPLTHQAVTIQAPLAADFYSVVEGLGWRLPDLAACGQTRLAQPVSEATSEPPSEPTSQKAA